MNPAKELGPLSDYTLLLIADGLEIASQAGLDSMRRELGGSETLSGAELAQAVRHKRGLRPGQVTEDTGQ